MTFTTRPLDPTTWDAFAELVERNNGVYGGCWCMGGYPEGLSHTDAAANRSSKHRRVQAGAAHAALVFDEAGLAQGWCQYGDPDELSRMKHGRAYAQEPPPRPDWRIQCVFVDRRHRGQGVARAALEGALAQIAELGGGRVEAISEVTAGRSRAGQIPVQRDGRTVRAVRLHARAPTGQACVPPVAVRPAGGVGLSSSV